LDLSPPAAHFSQRLHTHTEGNPFFLAETLRALVEEGVLYRDEEGSWRTPREGSMVEDAELPVPRTIARSIELRLARLAPVERDLLDVAAIIGHRVEFDLWLAASKSNEATTLLVAEELTRRGLLVEADDISGHRFAHDTIRQVVHETMSSMRRRQWHRRVAAALQARKPDQVEALARHYQLGQEWPQAVHYALQAGERARVVYANQQALAYYDAADNWLAQGRVPWPEHQVARWRADLAEKQGQVHSLLGHREEAEQAFGWAQEMWADLGDWRGEARVLNRWSFLCSVRDDPASAGRYANLALAALPIPSTGGGGDTEGLADLRATSLTHLGLSAWAQGRHDEALPPLEEALALFEESGTNLRGLARCLNSLGQVHLKRGDLELASRCFARSLALRQQIGDRHGEGWCWCNQGRTALAQGDLAAARRHLETAQAIFAETQCADGLNTCAQALSDLEQAEATAQPTTRITIRLPRAGVPLGRPLREDEWVTVTWTVAAPEDQALAGKVTRRHHRLLRLLDEARAQGAAPTQQHLAEAVGVSRRTIERDMAFLRQQTQELPPTRGQMSD
jgi:tetratricopeptide (TPR) repeat protein